VLGTRYHLTQGKIRDLLADVVGVDFSVGAISQAHAKVALALKAPLAEVAVALAEAPVVQIDETHYPREGASHWAWGLVTPKLVSYRLLASRARYVAVHLLGEKPACVFQLIVDGRFSRSWTAFQTNVDDVSG